MCTPNDRYDDDWERLINFLSIKAPEIIVVRDVKTSSRTEVDYSDDGGDD